MAQKLNAGENAVSRSASEISSSASRKAAELARRAGNRALQVFVVDLPLVPASPGALRPFANFGGELVERRSHRWLAPSAAQLRWSCPVALGHRRVSPVAD